MPTTTHTYSSAGADHKHGEVRRVARQAEDGRLEVLGVTTEIDQSDEFSRVLANLFHRARFTVI